VAPATAVQPNVAVVLVIALAVSPVGIAQAEEVVLKVDVVENAETERPEHTVWI
jgi:hypothetical protein